MHMPGHSVPTLKAKEVYLYTSFQKVKARATGNKELGNPESKPRHLVELNFVLFCFRFF
jgi:hypothetical protein